MKKYLFVLFTIFILCSFKEKELTWVAIGDSITYLNDHPDETGNRVKKGYLTRVTELLPNLRYINQGHNGWTSGAIAGDIEHLGLVKADVYSVFLGTNDWWQGRPVGKVEDYQHGNDNTTAYGSFRIIINKIRQLNPEAKIVLITPMQRNDFVYIADANNNAFGSYQNKNEQSLEEFANAVIAIGQYEHVPVVDLYHHPLLKIENLVNFKRLKDPQNGKYVNYTYPRSTGIPFDPKNDDYPYPPEAVNLTYDGLHPSDKGNAIIATALSAAFKQLGLAPRWDKYINLEKYNEPFWKADTITDERTQIIKDHDRASGALLFNARKVLSVKSADQSTTFVKGRDWSYANGKISIGGESKIPFLKKEELVFTEKKPDLSMAGKAPGTFVLFSENAYFSARQVSVTYIPEKRRKWSGPVPVYQESNLPLTLNKLSAKKQLNIVFYGNSIETGYNASGFEDVAPYMPVWPELVVYHLRSVYGAQVTYTNTSVAGKLAKWGLDSVSTRVTAYHPDLVVIGFGMNDGSENISPGQFREQINGIMNSVSAINPETEFILIAPMLPNPDAVQCGLQGRYKAELAKLVKKGVALADLTGVHAALLKRKSYQDMTGNNVNHPNDYLARWYAQMINGLLVK
ncbi:SGNH/GDSL hydrolase family protein [Mucilaginibacter aquariorum]|uniref:SGNH/GDSL hydrolase family protein n=1 Tax=Mucilaginibacter aquariorum TaxID=2967225 RepID=A0ABT1T804_9SPHI|nr:SGNH/GDSL hydrolase family protein [Mucilaginibacter aquariorum]MCQ6960761.1 SGNH/GDSL hydrolase family protein [Mucilaginibacter aquariorum]